MRQCLEDFINENCVLTLSQINGELKRRLPAKPLIHDRTVALNAEGMLFRVKLVRPVPADRNRRGVFQRRQEYGNWLPNHAIMRHCVFKDESSYHIWTSRNHGGARQGESAYRQVCGQQGRNVTVALAVSTVNGLQFHSAYIGGMNVPRLNDFLARRGKILTPTRRFSSFTTVRQLIEILPYSRAIPSWRCSRPTTHSWT